METVDVATRDFQALLPGRVCQARWPLADGGLAILTRRPLASQGLSAGSQPARSVIFSGYWGCRPQLKGHSPCPPCLSQALTRRARRISVTSVLKLFFAQSTRRPQREEEKSSRRKENLTANGAAAVKRSRGALHSLHHLSRSRSSWASLTPFLTNLRRWARGAGRAGL